MKTLSLGIACLILSVSSFSQVVLKRSVIGSAGSIKRAGFNSSLVIVNSVAQPSNIQMKKGEQVTLLQGFVQPIELRSLFSPSEVMVYPNPSPGVVHTSIRDKTRIIEVSVYSIDGRLAKKLSLGNNERLFDLSELPKGIYTLKFESENKYLGTRKIMLK